MSEAATGVPRIAAKDPRLRARDERLEALKNTVGRLAHDFNNLLAPFLGYVTLIKEDAVEGSPLLQYLQAMETGARRGEAYLDAILLGMRPHRRFSPGHFEFHTLVERLAREWEAGLPEDGSIRVHTELVECRLLADESQWTKAIHQLLANARFALALGGNLHIRLKKETLSGELLEALGLREPEVFRLEVEDDGIGMPPAVAERAFEPFFSTRTQIKAPGLGLTIVHSVAQQHGGQADLASAEDRGTRVTVWIPAPASPAADLGRGRSSYTQSAPKKRVLVAAADPVVKELLRTWLQSPALEVYSADGIADGLKMAVRYKADLRLLIADAQLKDGTGLELLQQTDLAGVPAPALLLATKEKPGSKVDGARMEVLQKPFGMRAFIEAVQRALGD